MSLTIEPWYVLSRVLNSSWWNYFYNFFITNFLGVLFHQDLFSSLSVLFEARSLKYCYFARVSDALLIGYNNIHPPMFYLFLWSVIVLSSEERVVRLWFLFFFGLIIFYWGSLWGVGNAAWGYFWVKDAIEVVLFTSLCVVGFALHCPIKVVFVTRILTIFFTLGITLLLLRWGLVFTRHSFFNLLSTVNIFKFYPAALQPLSPAFITLIFAAVYYWSFVIVIYTLTTFGLSFLDSDSRLNKYLLFHYLSLLFIVSWLKYQPHNFTVYMPVNSLGEIFYSATNNFVSGDLKLLGLAKHSFKRLAVFLTYFTYTLKPLTTQIYVYISWSRFFVLFLILMSMRKIYN